MLVFVQFWIHLALVVIGIAYFLYSYIKERNLYQLLFVIWIPLTMLTYVSKNRVYLTILGIGPAAVFRFGDFLFVPQAQTEG